MLEQEKQDLFLNKLGRKRADELDRIWKNSYPRYCSLYDEYPRRHTEEEIFEASAKKAGFSEAEIDLFLSL